MVDPDKLYLNSVWKTIDTDGEKPPISALDADALYELCAAEEGTLRVLEEGDLCYKCPADGDDSMSPRRKCLQPYSLVAAARLYLNFLDGVLEPELVQPSISCTSLRVNWTASIQAQFTSLLMDCTNHLLEKTELKPLDNGKLSNCPIPLFTAPLVSSLLNQDQCMTSMDTCSR